MVHSCFNLPELFEGDTCLGTESKAAEVPLLEGTEGPSADEILLWKESWPTQTC